MLAEYVDLTSWITSQHGQWHWLNRLFLGNELWRWAAVAATLVVAWLVGRVLGWLLMALGARSESRSRHLLAVMFKQLAHPAALAVLVLGLHLSMGWLLLSPGARIAEHTWTLVLSTAVVGYAAYALVHVIDEWLRVFSSKTPSKLDDMLVPLVRTSLRGAILVLVIAQVAFFVSGTQVTSIVAGLGVGALAIGLAAQDTIKNFFGSMMICSDRPFEMGDQIIVDGHEGSVESVGFRSTRFRTGEGHIVTIRNGELANKPIVNVSRRRNLQRKVTIPLPANLPLEKLERALDEVRRVLENHEGMSPDMPPRVHLTDVTPAGLTIQATYWYHPPDYWRFMAFSERVNLEILRRLAALEIPLAGPGPTKLAEPPAAKAVK